MIENVQIPKEYITLNKEIGRGHYGVVYSADLRDKNSEDDNNFSRKVAVKMLFGDFEKDDCLSQSLLREGAIMSLFHHQNVLSLIGVSFWDCDTPMIVMPFMELGNLKNYIKNKDRVSLYQKKN